VFGFRIVEFDIQFVGKNFPMGWPGNRIRFREEESLAAGPAAGPGE
jgi:hypothetical protein